ncbi:hypothetical protein [Methyloglobulus sp.]|uniref:hypothetical protein n=1 Tax=Methyloglobulus sp. TaxID=2518622 RepID=UPI0032B74D17
MVAMVVIIAVVAMAAIASDIDIPIDIHIRVVDIDVPVDFVAAVNNFISINMPITVDVDTCAATYLASCSIPWEYAKSYGY